MTTVLSNSKTPLEDAVDSLNAAFAADPAAIQTLLCMRVPCNDALADHPTVQVGKDGLAPDSKQWTLGALGLINGIIEPMTGFRIQTCWSEPNEFGKATLLGFGIYDPKDYKELAVV